MWVLKQNGAMLEGFVQNHGPTPAKVHSLVLIGPDEPVAGEAAHLPWDRFLAPGDYKEMVVPWPFDDVPQYPLDLRVHFSAADGSNYWACYTVKLLRNGADVNGEPMWRSGESRVDRRPGPE